MTFLYALIIYVFAVSIWQLVATVNEYEEDDDPDTDTGKALGGLRIGTWIVCVYLLPVSVVFRSINTKDHNRRILVLVLFTVDGSIFLSCGLHLQELDDQLVPEEAEDSTRWTLLLCTIMPETML